jgi:transposase
MGTAVKTARTSPASWDAFTDVDAFVDEVLVELAAMETDGTKPTRSGPKPALAGAALRKAIMAIWCLCFCGMQWRAIGQLSDIPFGTLFTLFARWTRLGLWRRLLDRLRRTWRLACGDKAEPSAVVIDSRSCKSAPSCFTRGFDGGKKIQGVKIHLGVDKHGIPLAIDVSPANVHGPWQRRQAVYERHRASAPRALRPRFPGIGVGRSRLPGQTAGQGRGGARPHRQSDRSRP